MNIPSIKAIGTNVKNAMGSVGSTAYGVKALAKERVGNFAQNTQAGKFMSENKNVITGSVITLVAIGAFIKMVSSIVNKIKSNKD